MLLQEVTYATITLELKGFAVSGGITSDEAVTAHLKAGVPPSMLVMGMPFYGRGGDGYPSFQDFNKVGSTGGDYTEKWDTVAQVPYLVNKNDTLVFGFENARSLAIKCQFLLITYRCPDIFHQKCKVLRVIG